MACADDVGEVAGYEWRDGADGLGYYRRDARAESLLVLRLAAAAGAPFVRCAEDVGAVAGYDFRDCGGAGDDTGYYRRPDAPPPDDREYSRLVLQRASAAGAAFVACPEQMGELRGYAFREGEEGRGYYRVRREAPVQAAPAYDEFERAMQELGAV